MNESNFEIKIKWFKKKNEVNWSFQYISTSTLISNSNQFELFSFFFFFFLFSFSLWRVRSFAPRFLSTEAIALPQTKSLNPPRHTIVWHCMQVSSLVNYLLPTADSDYAFRGLKEILPPKEDGRKYKWQVGWGEGEGEDGRKCQKCGWTHQWRSTSR